ncbi:hypothetical protein SRA_09556 [Streptococcus ratti FA-1 = DSM 20564]|uniref:Uncharacterized protein n=1 Tax=Streptococcus ratti FA-1 = DSM 20564 TaxID=699248 RepID=A0ABP2R0K1_STRRT|nr:hypothetical protein SRA_09556 [Streptococcus ratti FA-1 = DSM 20564]
MWIFHLQLWKTFVFYGKIFLLQIFIGAHYDKK